MDRAADFLDADPAVDMTANGDSDPGPRKQSGQAQSRFRRLTTAPWKRLVTVEDLFPLAQLAFFMLLPPPLDSLVWALLVVLTIVIVLRVWNRYRSGDS